MNNLKQYCKVKINKQKSTSIKRNNENIIFPKIRIKNDVDNNDNSHNSFEDSMKDDNKNYNFHNSNINIKIINTKNPKSQKV